jgi:hypothetical protein
MSYRGKENCAARRAKDDNTVRHTEDAFLMPDICDKATDTQTLIIFNIYCFPPPPR